MKARIRFWVARRKKIRELENKMRDNIGELINKNHLMITIDPKPYQ